MSDQSIISHGSGMFLTIYVLLDETPRGQFNFISSGWHSPRTPMDLLMTWTGRL